MVSGPCPHLGMKPGRVSYLGVAGTRLYRLAVFLDDENSSNWVVPASDRVRQPARVTRVALALGVAVCRSTMTRQSQGPSRSLPRYWSLTLSAGIALACGAQAVQSGASVGEIGRDLAINAQSVPQGAQICLWQESLGSQSVPGTEKPVSETCGSALKSDLLWRRAVLVLSLYGEHVGNVAAGADAESSGRLEAARSGITTADWSDVNDQGVRDAVTSIVSQMSPAAGTKSDLSKIVQDASGPVKTVCDGLISYLDAQTQSLAAIQKDIDKRRTNRAIRRCGTLDKQTVCVADSVVDRLAYADSFGQVFALQNSTLEGRDSVARFCAAHQKLAAAAANGQVTKKQTNADIVESVKSVPRAQPAWSSGEPAKPAESAKSAEPAEPVKK